LFLDVLIVIMAVLMMPRMTALMKCETISQTIEEFCFLISIGDLWEHNVNMSGGGGGGGGSSGGASGWRWQS
jgi:hypothetical protein